MTEINMSDTGSNDKLEELIKGLFAAGEIYKSKVEIYRKIGLENLGLSNLNGGMQKQKAFDVVSQYMLIVPAKEVGREVVIAEIFETPKYIVKTDNRGRRGVYVDRTVPICINALAKKNSTVVIMTVDGMALKFGLLKQRLSYDAYKDELLRINEKISRKMYGYFYDRCRPIVERIVFTTLEQLENEHKVIEYDKVYQITKKSGEQFISVKVDKEIIAECEKKTLALFGVDKITQIHRKGKANEFYSKVIETINDIYELEWQGYSKAIRIYIQEDKIRELCHNLKLTEELIVEMKEAVKEQFIKYLQNKTLNDFMKTNELADSIMEEWEREKENINVEDLITDEEIKEGYKMGVFPREQIFEIYAKPPKPFRYYPDYPDIQNALISYFVGEQLNEVEEDMSWLEDL